MNIGVEIGSLRPRLIHRSCGGWLAVTPEGAGLQFGVTAETENQAREEFSRTLERWVEILAADRAEAS